MKTTTNKATETKGTLVEVLEKFHFAGEKKPRLAFVTWRIGDGERRAVAVRDEYPR
jgi:hypothetical protein